MAICYFHIMCFLRIFLTVHARPPNMEATFSKEAQRQSVYDNSKTSDVGFQIRNKEYRKLPESEKEYAAEDNVYSANGDVRDLHVISDCQLNMPNPLHSFGNIALHLRDPPKDAPLYMRELYDVTVRKHRSHGQSNIVRSFVNINQDVNFSFMGTDGLILGSKTRVHSLIFNLTAVSSDEEINLAQIRLYKLVEHDRNTYIGEDRKVGLYEIIREGSTHARMVASRHIYGRHSGWEVFDVTNYVQRWLGNWDLLQILEVRIESVFHSVSDGDMDIDTSFVNKNEPLLVVFSSELRLRKLYKDEIREITQHEKEYRQLNLGNNHINNNALLRGNGHVTEQRYRARKRSRTHGRRKRSGGRIRKTRRINCSRKRMMVYFEDIHWDFVIYPKKYNAYECTGKCYYPILPRFYHTYHAKIQANMNFLYGRTISRPCCVPTKLRPMTLIYMEKSAIAMKYANYDGMIVHRCGCR